MNFDFSQINNVKLSVPTKKQKYRDNTKTIVFHQ